MTDEKERTGVLVKPIWLMQYGLLLVLSLAIGPAVFSSEWIGSSDFHACIEMSGSLIAIVAGISGILLFYSKGNSFFLIVGLGFFIAGGEDMVHGLLGFERMWSDGGVGFSRFIPATCLPGRMLLGLSIFPLSLTADKIVTY